MKEIGKTRNDSQDFQNRFKATNTDMMRKFINDKLNDENSKSDKNSR
jgi:hypothetical protein